jgi:UDP-GlcNAc:undecaprenyl-phosphate GlcNAc-1-phosphate transferase
MIAFLLATVLPGFLIALAGGFAVRRLAPSFGLLDRPGHRKIHTEPVPLGGGLAIWAGLFVGLLLVLFGGALVLRSPSIGRTISYWPLAGQIYQLLETHAGGIQRQLPDVMFLLVCSTVLMLLGLADDLRGLDWRLRLAVQLGVAVIVVVWKGWKLTAFVEWPILTDVLSVLWIVGLVNSFNMLDNMDGLSAGVAAIASAIMAAVLLMAPDPETSGPQFFVAGFLLMLVGSLAGFLWHNRAPARLFMGDAGSYLIGFLIAVCTMLATFAGGDLPRHAILAPVCALAEPLYDTISVVCIRLREGRSPFEADKNHFSHRLVDLGLSKTQAVLTIYLTTAACGLGALVLYQVNVAGAITITLSIACLLAVIAILEATARRRDNDKRTRQKKGRP